MDYAFEDHFFSMDPEFNALALFNLVDANCDLTGPFNYDKLKVFMSYHVPRVSMNDFLTGLESFFNIRFFVNNITRTIRLLSVDEIVKSTETIDFSTDVSTIYTQIGDPVKGFHLKMTMETDDQWWTQAKDGQALILDNIKDAVDSIADLPVWPSSPNLEIRFVRNEQKYYVMYNRVWGVAYLTEGNMALKSEFIHHESDVEIETKFSTLMNIPDDPYDCLIGSAQSGWQDAAPKLMFIKFHPWSGAGFDDERVYASNYSDNHSLFYWGPNGLYAKHYKAFCDLKMEGKWVKIMKKMTLLEIDSLDFSRKYSINGNNYLLSEVQVAIKNSGIQPATILAINCL